MSGAGLALALPRLFKYRTDDKTMNRKLIALPIALVCWFGSSVATPAGQPPTVSEDLAHHPAGVHVHRVIVQADDGALAVLRRGVHGLLRREVNGAMALEVTDAQLDAL